MATAKRQFNDKEYWKKRHENVGTLEASGLQAVGLKANDHIYKILADQYRKLLDTLDQSSIKSILDCGYGDGYFLKFFANYYGDKELHGIDISPEAKKKIDFMDKKQLHVGDLADFNLGRKFDLVHCFDVLYHVLDENDYVKSLENMAKHSNKYVALHERFFDKTPMITSKHVRMRRREVTDQILNGQGFFLRTEIPTHFFAMRMFSHKLNAIVPGVLHKLDENIAANAADHLQERLASHKIKIYQRAVT